MLFLFSGGASVSGSSLQVWLVFAVGALLVVLLAALIRSLLTVVLEPAGHRLDRWRRVWFHPERDFSRLLEALLIIAFVVSFARTYELPAWVIPVLAGFWALHLPVDFWSWLRMRRSPERTRRLHERGFLLLALGPLWMRAALTLLAATMYFLVVPLRAALDKMMMVVFASLQGWFS